MWGGGGGGLEVLHFCTSRHLTAQMCKLACILLVHSFFLSLICNALCYLWLFITMSVSDSRACLEIKFFGVDGENSMS